MRVSVVVCKVLLVELLLWLHVSLAVRIVQVHLVQVDTQIVYHREDALHQVSLSPVSTISLILTIEPDVDIGHLLMLISTSVATSIILL